MSRLALVALALALAAFGLASAADGDAAAAASDATITVGTKIAPPFVIAEGDGQGDLDGISVRLMRRIAQHEGWDLDWRRYELEELLGAVATQEVDLGIAAISVSAERERQMDFSHRYFTAGLGIAVAPGGNQWLNLMQRLFSWQFLSALLALCAVLLGSGLAVWWFERKHNEDFGGDTVHGIGSAFWWSAVTMTTVGYGDKSPKTTGGRVVALCWMFASVIVISTFTAGIATSLTLDGISSGITGIHDLEDRTSAVVGGSQAAAEMDERGLETREVDNLAAALDLLEQGRVDAVVHDQALLRYRIDQESREVQVLDTLFAKQGYAIALPPGSQLRERINRVLLEMQADGDLERLVDVYLR